MAKHPSRALVMGGGVAGLTTARVLADHFDEVVVLERGHYPAEASPRKHVPQSNHLHYLLARGGEVLQSLFPRMGTLLDSLGVPQKDFGADIIQYVGERVMPRIPVGIPMRCVTRPLLEWALHHEIARWPGVRVLEGHKVQGLLLDARGDVAGVTVEGESGATTMESDLVVDASGRASPLPGLLRRLGCDEVPEEIVDAGFRYASSYFRIHRPEHLHGAASVGVVSVPPAHPITGGLMQLPNGDSLVTVIVLPEKSGLVSDHDSLIGMFDKTPCVPLRQALTHAEAISPIRPYQDTANRRRRYDRVESLPGRLVAIGDSACVLNPRFGQGMTMAALGARELQRHLAVHSAASLEAKPRQWTTDLRTRLLKAYQVPWAIATSDDFNWIPDARHDWKSRAAAWYLKALVECSPTNPKVYFQQMRVAQMLAHPLSLLRPDFALPIVKHGLSVSMKPAR